MMFITMKSLLKIYRRFYANFNKRFLFTNASEKLKLHAIHNTQNVNDEDKPRVLIVGAGISGLSAAYYLIQNGINNVKIIEASTRVGGRIHSVYFGDTVCELGAKWINEPNLNDSIFRLASVDNDLKNYPQNYKKICLTNDGDCIDSNLSYSVALAFNDILNQEIPLSNDFEKISRIYLQNEINKILKENFENADELTYKMFLAHNDVLSGFFGSDLLFVHTSSIKKIAKAFKNPIFIKSGLNQITTQLMETIGKERIFLGHPIGTIHWANFAFPEIPIIYCLNGSRFTADHVIFTLPLGAMKMFHHIFFNPLLPKPKIQAIFSLGFGFPTKIYLKYEQNIHKWLPDAIKLVWTATEPNSMREWSKHITEISPVPESNQVLELKVNGQISESVERLTDGVICDKATNVLRRFLRNRRIPFPNDILRSNWSSDAKYFGGLPFLSLLSKEEHITELGRPIYSTKNSNVPTLLFAGDATISDGFGTLNGAMKSGVREAMRIVKLYNKTG